MNAQTLIDWKHATHSGRISASIHRCTHAGAPIIDMSAIEILYEDTELAVINKPSGISMLRDRSGEPDLWSGLKARFADEGKTAHLVHRLDKGTSGALLIALSLANQKHLTRAFQRRQVRKFYAARCVAPLPIHGTGEVNLPLTRGRKSRYRIAGDRRHIVTQSTDGHTRWTLPRSKVFKERAAHEAITRFRIANRARTLLSVQALTGRTHQIRVHFAWIGYPILGDHLYGAPNDPAQRWPRLALHCHRLVVPTLDGESLGVCAPLPPRFLK